jgi:hypothetical protein
MGDLRAEAADERTLGLLMAGCDPTSSTPVETPA